MRPLLPIAFLLSPAPAFAAQIVALDLKPEGDVVPKLARTLNPIYLTELSRVEGMSVISQDDVRALLELEANKQQLGCTDTACLTEIAGSLGAELMASGTISKLGGTWITSIVLIRVESAQVVKRATGKSQGGETVAEESVVAAVRSLFKEGVPSELQGPASLSRRGFRAALAGFRRAVLDPTADVRANRRRIILDLVHTELDYDATPKLEMLDLEIRRGSSEVRTQLLTAKDSADLERYLSALDQYRVLADDLGRVKEIRVRSRERGTIPSAQPLRFEDPEPLDRPEPEEIKAYQETIEKPRQVVGEAIKAFDKRDKVSFRRQWLADRPGNADRAFDELDDYQKRYKQRCELLPFHATAPDEYDSVIGSMKDGSFVVLLRCFRDGKIYDDDRVWVQKEGTAWKISGW